MERGTKETMVLEIFSILTGWCHMGTHISKTPSNCAPQDLCIQYIYDVYSTFQLKREKCNNKTHLSHKVFRACPCTDPLPHWPESPSSYLSCCCSQCGAGPPLPGSVQIGPGKRPPFQRWHHVPPCLVLQPVPSSVETAPTPHPSHTSLGGTQQHGAGE